jgi:hypothetical protein
MELFKHVDKLNEKINKIKGEKENIIKLIKDNVVVNLKDYLKSLNITSDFDIKVAESGNCIIIKFNSALTWKCEMFVTSDDIFLYGNFDHKLKLSQLLEIQSIINKELDKIYNEL